MAVTQQYKCLNCGGAISFDSDSQTLKCHYCGTEFEVSVLEEYENCVGQEYADSFDWQIAAGSEWDGDERYTLKTYVCSSCGGEVVGEETTAASFCPYCSNPVIMTDNLSGILRPDLVIPFKLNKEQAKEALKKHYKGKRFLPKDFTKDNRIDEIKGIYVPFWLFEADVDASVRYRATRVRVWSDANFTYTKTSFYLILRNGTLGFERVPVDGSSRMADDLMESIEPFDIGEAVDFHTAYLSGFFADKYDVDASQSIDRANARIKKSTEEIFESTVNGYSTIRTEYSGIRLHNSNAKYALYPVWMLNTKYKDKTYTFAMNGQSGKMVGNLPIDKKKFARWLFGLTGIISAVGFAISSLIWYL